jgi:hypothetical protein
MYDEYTVHLVYPVDDQKSSSPWSVGNHLIEGLQGHFKIVVHNWQANYRIIPKPNDILLGHPHPRRNTVFRKSFNGAWASRYVICPFTTNPQQMYFVERYALQADAFFAICGPVWAEKITTSMYAHLGERFVHLDMAIDTQEWPPLDRAFAEPKKRKFAFIGSSLALKGTPFLEQLAVRRPNEIGWIGASRWVRSNAECTNYLDLATDKGREALAEYDFVISPGRSDANPTVLLEAMSLGLLPICTKESGYDDAEHFYSLEYGDIEKGMALLNSLQTLPHNDLVDRRNKNYSFVQIFSWDRFMRIVSERILRDIAQGSERHTKNIKKSFKIQEFSRSYNSPYRRWRSSALIKVVENRLYFRFAQFSKLMHK